MVLGKLANLTVGRNGQNIAGEIADLTATQTTQL